MWIVLLALRRPYTFVVASLLAAILGIVMIARMPTDIFPEINIPVVSVIFNYPGMSADDMEKRVSSQFERFNVQTNVVHTDAKRSVLLSIYKLGNASTLRVVNSVMQALPGIRSTLPPEMKIDPLFDQSIFVRASVQGVIKGALLAAGLTALMILLFLGSWRSTLIVMISIPLSIVVSIIVLAFLGETLKVMTLGGMALAVGILVDDATVAIENIHRNLHQKKTLVRAILDGSAQIAVPAFVATLCICIVFVPVVFISGAARYLFTPLAMAVVFAMLTSYLLSRTLVPTMVHYLLAGEVELYGGVPDPNDPHAQLLMSRHAHPPGWKRMLRGRGARLSVLLAAAVAAVAWSCGAGPWLTLHAVVLTEGVLALMALFSLGYLVIRLHDPFNRAFERLRFVVWRPARLVAGAHLAVSRRLRPVGGRLVRPVEPRRRGLLSGSGRWATALACALPPRHAHRGNRAAFRAGAGRHPRGDPGRRNRHGHRQHGHP